MKRRLQPALLHIRWLPGLLCALLFSPAPGLKAQGQSAEPETRQESLLRKRREKLQKLTPEKVSEWESFLVNYEKKPTWQKLTIKGYSGFRLLVGGMPQGSGFAYGVGWVNNINNPEYRLTVNARSSSKLYEQLDFRFDLPAPSEESPLGLFVEGGYRDYRNHNFFGLGNFSPDDRTTFRLEERFAQAGASWLPHRMLALQGRVGFLNSNVFSGEEEPSVEEAFPLAALPGFGSQAQPEYLVYGGDFELRLTDVDLRPVGVVFRGAVDRFDGRGAGVAGLGSGSFLRAVGEAEVHIPLGYRNRRIAYRIRTSHSMPDSGDTIPFYMLETIGGAKSLRGFEEFRFRDRRNLSMNLEYRWEVWQFVDFALFADAGKVFRRAGDLDFSDLHASYGGGMIVRLPRGFGGFRIDLARSQEGIQIHIGAGPDF